MAQRIVVIGGGAAGIGETRVTAIDTGRKSISVDGEGEAGTGPAGSSAPDRP